MNCYVIGIGGTGAKCIEALIHLCAAGLLPLGSKLFILFVDPDRANGSLGQTRATLQAYQQCQQGIDKGNIPLLNIPIETGSNEVWSPFSDMKQRPSLENIFQYSSMQDSRPDLANLLNVLYIPNERKTDLDVGFRGHPSIGAAVLATTVQWQDPEWNLFRQKLRADVRVGSGARVFLFGSIFGGTGAAGLPTLLKLIGRELKTIDPQGKHSQIGASLLLPYFTFVDDGSEPGLGANSENFLLNTKAALKYYGQQITAFDKVYLLGDDVPSQVNTFSKGGERQKNNSHIVELYAGLAAIDFFTGSKTQREPECNFIARKSRDKIEWDDIPNSNEFKEKLASLVRFSVAYREYHQALRQPIKTGKILYKTWYQRFFLKPQIDLTKDIAKIQLYQIRDYCELFLDWLTQIHQYCQSKKVELFRVEILQNFRKSEFGNLVYGLENINEMEMLNRHFNDLKWENCEGLSLGKFINGLYKTYKLP